MLVGRRLNGASPQVGFCATRFVIKGENVSD